MAGALRHSVPRRGQRQARASPPSLTTLLGLAACSSLVLPAVQAFDWGLGWGGGGPKGSGGTLQHASDDLTADQFDPYLQENPVTAVLFYAPWCFYSQQVMPAWDLAGQKLKIHDPPVRLVKIDTHRYGSVGEKYGVNAFPTMKLFVDGAVFEYDSQMGRGWQQIVKWVNGHIDRDHVLKSVDDVDHYLNDNDLNVIGLFTDEAAERNNSIFARSSRHFEDISFAESRSTAVSQGVAEHLARHATLLCETIDVGQSSSPRKDQELPREKMHCSSTPRNPQRPEWSDRFNATVQGKTLVVHRADQAQGWQQLLQIRCCDEETAEAKARIQPIPVPSIVMFMPHDERFARYDGDLSDIHALDRWISARRSPMIIRFSQETAEKILDNGPEKTPVLFFISQSGPTPPVEQELRKAARALRGRALFCLSGLSSPIEKRLADLAGVDEDSLPVATLVEAHGVHGQYHSSRKYRLPVQGLTMDKVVQFITDHETGQLQPWLKSEPKPAAEDQRPGQVYVVVGSTFTETAQDTTRDVLIDFYAPWCGHCRKFEPAYKELAKRLKHVKSLRISKVDATRNEVEGMSIMGFPTIVLFPAGASPKRQVVYHGSRQPDDMIRWLKEHATLKFDDRPPKEEVKQPTAQSGLLDEAEEADL